MVEESSAGATGDRAAEQGDDERAGVTIIKKYANRRLYDTGKSSYVTLDDLARMVRAGEDFAVRDARTGEDITRSVLTQIIVEAESRDHSLLPTAFLRELIRLYGDPMQGMVPGYLEATMEAFRQNQAHLSRAFGANPAVESFEALARQNMELFQRSMQMFSPLGQGQGAPRKPAAGPAPRRPQPEADVTAAAGKARDAGIADDLDALQKQLREMQAQLERLSRSKD